MDRVLLHYSEDVGLRYGQQNASVCGLVCENEREKKKKMDVKVVGSGYWSGRNNSPVNVHGEVRESKLWAIIWHQRGNLNLTTHRRCEG